MTQTTAVPHCCTARIIVGFVESQVAEGGNGKMDEEKLEKTILSYIKNQYLYGYAMLIAFTNNEQVTANKVFKRLKFKCSKWASKSNHKNTKIRLWYINLEDAQTIHK